ncbi:hypothetical protein MJO28_005259, partial [Puccinia striiformis f. sp. tritici]
MPLIPFKFLFSPPEFRFSSEEGLSCQMQDQLTYKEANFLFDCVSWPPTNPLKRDLSQDLGTPLIPTNSPITLQQKIPPAIPPRPAKNDTSSARKYMFPQAEPSSDSQLTYSQSLCYSAFASIHRVKHQISRCVRLQESLFLYQFKFAPGSIFSPQSELPFPSLQMCLAQRESLFLATSNLPLPISFNPILLFTLAGQHLTTAEQKKGVTLKPQTFPQPIVNAVFIKEPIPCCSLSQRFHPFTPTFQQHHQKQYGNLVRLSQHIHTNRSLLKSLLVLPRLSQNQTTNQTST